MFERVLLRASGLAALAARWASRWNTNRTPDRQGVRVRSNAAFARDLRHDTVATLLPRQNPSLVNRWLFRGGRRAALIDAELERIATVASYRAWLVFLRAGILGWWHTLQYGARFVTPGLAAEPSATLGC